MTKAKTVLEQFKAGPWSITIVKRDRVLFRSNMSGLSPLFQAIQQLGPELDRADIYDKVIGRAAAFLISSTDLRHVFTPVISQPAIEILRRNNRPVTYLKRVDRILDRNLKDLCPMEKLSLDADTPEQFLRLVTRTYGLSG